MISNNSSKAAWPAWYSERLAAKTIQPLRILIVMHMPWSRELGAPRVSIETAEELKHFGHTVDKFDIDDAFPERSKLGAFFEPALFPARAAKYVRQNGQNYDVIQAEQGNLPYTKQHLNFRGVLIARSNGLAHFYDEYARVLRTKQRERGPKQGSLAGNALRWAAKRLDGGLSNVNSSFAAADVISLNNQDEFNYVSRNPALSDKAFLLLNGLSEDRFMQFASQQTGPAERLASQQVVFIGHWSERKGSSDFPALVHAVRQRLPRTQFLFLGTGETAEAVLNAFEPSDKSAINIIPFFHSQHLPELLRKATVGVLPSYIEGFGIGVLEQLAAGIPSVAYDVPGPRAMLEHFSQPMLTPMGDVPALAEKIIDVLALPPNDYSVLFHEALQIAGRFRWRDIVSHLMQLCYDKQAEIDLQ